MKIKVFIMLIFAMFVFGLTLQVNYNDPVNVETGLKAMNRLTYRAVMDSTSNNIWMHKYKLANHDKADSATYYLTPNDSVYGTDDNFYKAISYALSIRNYLEDHFAADSSHCGAAETTTELPKAIDPITATYAQYNNFVDSLMSSYNAHLGRLISYRYKYIGKLWTAAFIAHCAKDTTDAAKVHWVPDETYNTVTFDSTNIDSVKASYIRLKGRFNGHLSLWGSKAANKAHHAFDRADSLTSPDPTNYSQLFDLVIEMRTKLNNHFAKDTLTTTPSGDWGNAVHLLRDPSVLTVATVTKGGGHIAADANTYSDQAYVNWAIPPNDRFTIQYTPAANDTANFYHYGSVNGLTYAFIDSVQIIGAAGVPQLKHLNTNYYPYMRIMMNAKKTFSGRNTGAWRIDFKGEK
jgi:hypothetical protein